MPELNSDGPSVVYPLLVLHFKGCADGTELFIEVGGAMDLYLSDYTDIVEAWRFLPEYDETHRKIRCAHDWQSRATPLLKSILDELALKGAKVNRVYPYTGSIRPGYMLRGGFFFARCDAAVEARRAGAGRTQAENIPFSKWPDIADIAAAVLKGAPAAV